MTFPSTPGGKELEAADKFVNSMVDRRDDYRNGGFLWHGWALRDAFYAGAQYARSEKGDVVLVPRNFLEAMPCPNCDGSGFMVSTGPDPEQEQCQWCYEKHMILSGAKRA